jgi:hypothetical protein
MDYNIEPGRVFTMDELAEAYSHQWLAVEVVERDEAGQPLKVTVLKRGVNAMTVREDVGKKAFCTLYTGPVPEIAHRGMF